MDSVTIDPRRTVKEANNLRRGGTPDCSAFQAGLSKAEREGPREDSMLDAALRQTGQLLPLAEKDDALYLWDQPGTKEAPTRGWRALVEKNDTKEALLQINAVLQAHPPERWPSRRVPRHVVAFHGLQIAAFEGAGRETIESLADASLDARDTIKWNAYVTATKCFILRDKKGFEEAFNQAHEGGNGEVLRRLAANYDKPYQIAYRGGV